MRAIRTAVLLAVLATAACSTARAADDIQLDPAETAQGWRKEVIAQVDDAAQKMTELAEVMPASKYAWRPGKGVRSVREVYLHVSAANYLLPTFLGFKPPAGVEPNTLEKSQRTKAEVVDELRRSFAHARRCIGGMSEADLSTEVEFFGHPSTRLSVLLTFVSHAHEHLGQSIAYARTNRVVPPWTARAEAKAPQRD